MGREEKEELRETESEKQNKIAKYTMKDSVFTSLFQDKKYLIQLYRALHPEDQETTEKELVDITIRNVLTNGLYNDLGFRVGDRIMILAEAQSSWTKNIIVRALLYLAQSYHNYFEQQNADLYSTRKVKVPEPELYMIFTGERVEKPKVLSLSDEFFNGKECALEVKVNVIYDGKENDIISQYVTFTKIYNEQLKKYGRSREAIMETIRICKDRDVLREYLTNCEKEVISIMMTLFDEERVMQSYIAGERQEAAREAAKKASEGTARKAVENMLKMGKLSVEEIARCFDELSVEDIRKIEEELFQIS